MHQISGRWQLGFALALCTAIMWGLLPIALKGVLGPMDPTTVTWFRFTVSATLIGIYLLRTTGIPLGRMWAPGARGAFFLASICLLSNFLWYVIGLDYTTASASQVLIQLAPMLMLLLSLLVFKETFSPGQAMGVLLFGLGLVLFFNLRLGEIWRSMLGGQGRYAFGLLMIVIAAVVWAVYGIIQKQLQRQFSSMEILWLIFTVGAISFAPFADYSAFARLSPLAWGCLVFAALNTIVAYGTFAIALQHWEASRVSASITLVPVFTMLSVHVVDLLVPSFLEPEPMNWLSWLGALLVVLGSMLAALLKGR